MTRRNTAVVGGAGVLVSTAGIASLEFLHPRAGPAYQLAGIVMIILLLGLAWLLARFVTRHGDEIGEARFDTRNKDEREHDG